MRTTLLANLLFLLIFSNCSYAQFRCGTHLVKRGDYKQDVLRKCGPPASVERFNGTGETHYYDFGYPQYNPDDQGFVEEWIYDFGGRRFRQYLRFDNGVLEETHSLAHGKDID